MALNLWLNEDGTREYRDDSFTCSSLKEQMKGTWKMDGETITFTFSAASVTSNESDGDRDYDKHREDHYETPQEKIFSVSQSAICLEGGEPAKLTKR